MSAISILLIEPDSTLSGRFSMILRNALYDVDAVPEGTPGIAMFATRHHHLLIVNHVLPDTDGCRLCQEVRRIDSGIPVLMLGHAADNALLESFSAGIDDYLILPIDHRELLARVRAVIRRALPGTTRSNRLITGDIVLDRDSMLVYKSGRLIAVTTSEFLLLEYMMRNKNRVITKEELALGAWGRHYRCQHLNLPIHMNNLRNKLKDDNCPHNLYTVSRKGYLLAEDSILQELH